MSAISKTIFPYIETIIITLAYIAVGIYFFPKDPLIIDSAVSFLPIILTIITLFNGSKHGILALVLTSVLLYFYYHQDMITLFLSHLLLVLILGQFYHYWYNKNRKSEQEYLFSKQRLEELSNAFYTLKISHNILEKNYALKPQSLRASIKELSREHFKNNFNYEDFLHLLNREFHAQGLIMAELKNGSFHTIASIEENKILQVNDPLVQKAIQTQETSYISEAVDKINSLYLTVIPIKDNHDRVIAILAIDKMPFLDFNQNNIINIAIVFSYFMDQIKLWKQIKSQGFNDLSPNALFTHSFNRMEHLQKEYGTNSCVIVFKTKDDYIEQKLTTVLNSLLRGLDVHYAFNEYTKNTIVLLLPFSPKETAANIIENILEKSKLKSEEFEYMTFDIEQKKSVFRYIEEKR